MRLEKRFTGHPEDVRCYDTTRLQNHFLFNNVFIKDEISLCYTHSDRVVFGGALPVAEKLRLGARNSAAMSFWTAGNWGSSVLTGTEP
jgi:4-deoxy-L-threo-5-hexosulose-uronate ketol-isomerase